MYLSPSMDKITIYSRNATSRTRDIYKKIATDDIATLNRIILNSRSCVITLTYFHVTSVLPQ